MSPTNLSRRAIMSGAAALPALAVPALALVTPDPIFAAIEKECPRRGIFGAVRLRE
jgi:hypothetical protein